MKFALALVASLAHAVKVDDLMDDLEDAVSVTLYDDMTWSAEYDYDWDDDWYDDEYCDNWWNWEECSQMWWRSACDWELEGDGCGWIYEDYWTWEEYWVSCDEFNSWDSCNGDDYWEDDYWYEDEYCYNEWNWEDCSQMWWRYGCDWELEGDGWGWIYYDDWTYEEYWVSGDDYSTWDSCNGDDYYTWEDEYCDNYWTWEDCSQMWYRDPCEWEIEGDGYGWIYEVYNYDTWTYDTFWVSGEEFESWEYCW